MSISFFYNLKRADKLSIQTALYLVKCSQSDFNSLELNIKKLAYRFNLAILPDLDSYNLKSKKDNDDVSLPPLTEKQKQLVDEFIKEVSDYLNSLPCFKSKLSNNEQSQIIESLKLYVNNRVGSYDYNERIRMLNADYMTNYLINNFNVIKIERGQTVLAYWDGETYLTGEQAISDLVTKIKSIEYNNSIDKCHRETLNLKVLINSLNNAITEVTPLAPSDYIPCLNGIVHIDRDNNQLELLPFNPDIVTVFQFRGNFKSLSEIPAETVNKIDRYFDYLFNREHETKAHCQELKDRCLEFCATILYRGQLFKKFGFFHGSHDGGKTSFIERALFALLPNDSYSKLPINRLNERFAISDLVGKLANLNDEHNFDYGRTGEAQQATIKEIVSGGKKLRAERKNVNAFDFVCEARMFIALNSFLNLTDPATAYKMLYIPMRGNLSLKECEAYYPDMTNQDERDYIFNVLLQYLQRVFNNFKTTGEYFTQSKYIDGLQSKAEIKTSDLLNELQSWIDETKPFKDYPLGQLLSDENKTLMLASHYYYKFKEYQSSINSRINITQLTFRTKISEVSPFKCLDNSKENGKSYNFILVPKHYNGASVNTYADYKQAILLEQAQRADTANIIDMNTKTEVGRVKTELGQTNKRGVLL